MTDSQRLFSRTIVPSGRLTLTEQVYDILCEEIHAGRWQIGDRLPSISAMAIESGLSRRPVQQALDRLREEGYVRQEQGSGTYLASLLPKGRTPLGSIGILVARREENEARPFSTVLNDLDHWRMHAILKIAAEHNYTEEIRYLPENHDGADIDKAGGLFSDRVKGVISLHQFPRVDHTELGPDDLPFVYLGYTGFPGTPCVALDLAEGFFQLTREVIAHGHRDIACFGWRFDVEDHTRQIYAGYERAMKEAGLPVNRDGFEESLLIPPSQLSEYRDYLNRHVGDSGATALVCAKNELAMNAISVADMMGLAVPEDLSVVSLLAGPMRVWKIDQRMTGIEYDVEHTVRVCFNLLTEQMKTRRNLVSLVRVKPLIRPGDSLVEPRRREEMSTAGDSNISQERDQ